MPDETPIFGLPTPLPEGEGANLPAAMGAQNERLEEVFAAGIRSADGADVTADQSSSSTVFTLLGTPDRVQDIVVPDGGLLFAVYEAQAEAGEARLFLDETPVGAALAFEDTTTIVTAAGSGLRSASGALFAPEVFVFPPSLYPDGGTFDVSVRFRKTGVPVVAAEDRQLCVWAQAFSGLPPA